VHEHADGRHVGVGERRVVPVQLAQHGGGRAVLDRVDLQRVAQPAHRRRGAHAVPDHVADRDEQPAVAEHQRVVPVAADAQARATGQVTAGDRQAGDVGQRRGQQRALQHLDHLAVAFVAFGVHHRGRDASRELERDGHVVGAVAAARERVAERERADRAVGADHRNGEVGAQRPPPERAVAALHRDARGERVGHLGRELGDQHRTTGSHRVARRHVVVECV
jgi:hypothetical protein